MTPDRYGICPRCGAEGDLEGSAEVTAPEGDVARCYSERWACETCRARWWESFEYLEKCEE